MVHPALHLLVVALVVLAGCGGTPPADGTSTAATAQTPAESPGSDPAATNEPEPGSATPTPTATSTPEPRVEVYGEPLPANGSFVWGRVVALAALEDDSPADVTVRDGIPRFTLPPPAFEALLGLETHESEPLANASGHVLNSAGVVIVIEGNASEPLVESVLAHEFAHVVQLRRDARERMRSAQRERAPDHADTSDAAAAHHAVTEGGAVFVQVHYTRRHAPGQDPVGAYRRAYRNGDPLLRDHLGDYVFGYGYVASRADDPASVHHIYDSPPTTTEQVIHRIPPGEEPPLELEVREPPDWRVAGRTAKGELYVRSILSKHLADDRAADAAAGWGNDRLVEAETDAGRVWVWALRWDTSADGRAFEAALRDYLDARANRTGSGRWVVDESAFRVVVPDDEVVVLVAGAPAAVDAAEVRVSADLETVAVVRED